MRLVRRKLLARYVPRPRGVDARPDYSIFQGEFNLDSGDKYTPQSYDISNIQVFTQSMQIVAQGCQTVKCTNANCGCSQAYPVGDTTGCGNDSPVRGCGAGAIAFTSEWCIRWCTWPQADSCRLQSHTARKSVESDTEMSLTDEAKDVPLALLSALLPALCLKRSKLFLIHPRYIYL